MDFCAFDESYVERLRAGDFRTQEHFVSYFSELIQVKLRSRVRSPQAIEDIRQETFSRVIAALRVEEGIRQPDKLGAFVNSTCNNVLLEYYRASSRDPVSEDDNLREEYPDTAPDALAQVVSHQMQEHVQRILAGLSERDRRLIKEVLLEERSKDEVCQELGVDREYLRVLLHRARQSFKAEYLRSTAPPARAAFR
jgi:RNA polymerase sigma-70 factor (ECF subfamily)